MRVWTHGNWVVKAGAEAAFEDAWTRLARAAMRAHEGEPPILLRDREHPNVFKTFGAWPSNEAIEAFRASDLFLGAVDEIRPLLESFEPFTLDEIEWA